MPPRDLDRTSRLLEDALDDEAEPDRGVYGEADEEALERGRRLTGAMRPAPK
jgi:hypothetical protein